MEVSVLSHLTNSALVVLLLQWLKGTAGYQKFAAAMPIASKKVHVLLSVLGAGGSALGMHSAVAGSVGAGYVLTLSIPPLWAVFHAAWDWVQQIALNWLTYVIAVQQRAAAPVGTVQVSPSVAVTASLEKP